ncbi:MAG: hypothetical protein ACSHX4_00600 [Opitutaceae bacterium]
MPKPTKEHQEEVKVEDLLRLKRMERPDDAFWGKFDRELHQRMLQTLVKKDPLHVQVFRALSGRFAQSSAVACAALFIAMMVVRPAFVGTGVTDFNVAETETTVSAPVLAVEMAMSDLDEAALNGQRDYQIERISTETNTADAAFTRDFGMDGYELALGSADYSADVAASRPAFGSTSVASLVY